MIRVALRLCGGNGDTHVVIPRVVEPDGSQDEHGQGNEEATDAHRIQISKGGPRVEARREDSS